MPSFGGSPYKRVASSLKTATEGPESLIDEDNDSDDGNKGDGGEDGIGQCEVQAFDVWYWSEDGSFVPETMYMNVKDAAHAAGDPRLVVSLTSFQALSEAYVKSIEKESVKSALLQEKENLLARCRVGYYKELQHLRDMLDMARQQMTMKNGVIDEATQRRLARFEKYVRETEVHYFDIVDTLDPELKAILQDAVKQFNRDLMREIFELKDRLALHEGGEADDALVERMITLLMGKGISPARIVKVLSGMITDQKQSEDFREALREILGISKPARRVDDEGPRRPVGKHGEEPPPRVAGEQPSGGGRRRLQSDDDRKAPEEGGGSGNEASALKMQLKQKDDEIARLKKLLEDQKKAMDEQKRAAEQAARDAEAKMKALEKAVQEAKAELAQARKERDAAIQERDAALSRAGARGADAGVGAHGGGGAHAGGGGSGAGGSGAGGAGGGGYGGGGGFGGGGMAGGGGGGAGGSGNDYDWEEAERIRKELERKLREAMEAIRRLNEQLAEQGGQGEDGSDHGGAGGASPFAGRGPRNISTPSRTARDPRPLSSGTGPNASASTLDSSGYSERKGRKSLILNKGVDLMDRNFGDELRGGEYSILTGRPIAMVEAELNAERKRRIGLEEEKRKLVAELSDIKTANDTLEENLEKEVQELQAVKARLENMLNQDELDGVDDISIFCRWLIKKYGSLDRGFRALDTNLNGSMCFTEFCKGLRDMGWINIVGKRLFKIIDPADKGHITLDMLWEVYRKYVEGNLEDPEIAKKMEQMMKDQEEAEKESLKIQLAKDRIAQLEADKVGLYDEIALLKKKAARAAGEADKPSMLQEAKQRGLERKLDTWKSGYENLKSERDELASKMTAAMWKCREAYILQVKYKREAEQKTDEYEKLNKKFDMYKTAFKNRSATMPAGGIEMMNSLGATPMPALGATAPESLLQAFATGGLNLTLIPYDGVDTAGADDTDPPGALSSTSEMASGVLGAVLTDGGGDRTPTPTPTLTEVCSPSSMRPGVARCPKCNALLRAIASSSAGGSLRETGNSMGGRATLGLDELPQSTIEDKLLSPEELIAKMSDEDLLNAMPGQSEHGGTSGAGGFSFGGTGHFGSGSTLPYRVRCATRLEAGHKSRQELLYLDSKDRARQRSPESMGDQYGGGHYHLSPTSTIMSKESHDLLEHARQIRLLWREAVPIDEVLPLRNQSPQSPTEAEQRLAGSARLQQTPSGAVTVGRGVMKQKLMPFEGASAIDEDLLQKLQAQVEQSAGKKAGEAFAAAAANVKRLHKQNLQPFEGSTGAAVVGSGLAQPGSINRSLERQDMKAQILEDYSRKVRDRSKSPDNSDTPQPPLSIVGANAPNDRIGTPPHHRPAGIVYAVQQDLAPGVEASRLRPPRSLEHLGGGAQFGLPHADLHDQVNPLWDLSDDGVHAFQDRSRGRKDVNGMWRSHHPGARAAKGEGSASAGEIGAGLPQASKLRSMAPKQGAPQRLPQLSQPPDHRGGAVVGGRGAGMGLRSSASMPDLAVDVGRPGKVPAPPMAVASAVPSPERIRPRRTPPENALARAAAEAPFEASSLRVGAAAPVGPTTRPSPAAAKRAYGAAKNVPKDTSRQQLLMAKGVFELGDHVQRHAASEMAPVVIQGDHLPTVHGVGSKALLA